MNKVFLNGQAILKLPSVCLYADSIHTEKNAYEGLLYLLKYNLDRGDQNTHDLYSFLVDAITIDQGEINFENLGFYEKFSKANADYAISNIGGDFVSDEKEALENELINSYKLLIDECYQNGWHPIIELSNRSLEMHNKKTLITEIPRLIPSATVPYEKIIKFKDKRRDELLKFRRFTTNFQSKLSAAESKSHVIDLMHEYKNNLELSLLDLKRLTGESKIRTTISSVCSILEAKSPGLVSSFIGGNAAIGSVAGINLNAPLLGTVLGGIWGVGVTVAGAYLSAKEKVKNSNVAYVFHAEKKSLLDSSSSKKIYWNVSEVEKAKSRSDLIFFNRVDEDLTKEIDNEKKKKEKIDRLMEKAQLMSMSGNIKQAIKLYSKLIDIVPENSFFFKKRGYLYAINKQLSKSLTDLNQSIFINDKDSESYNYRSAVKILLKQNKSALVDIYKAIELNPSVIYVLTEEQKELMNAEL